MTSTATSDHVTATSPRKSRRMARQADPAVANTSNIATSATAPAKAPSKLDCVEALLLASAGASIAELIAATGWQQHSVRGAMAGALKKRGLTISSDKIDGVRRYRAEQPA